MPIDSQVKEKFAKRIQACEAHLATLNLNIPAPQNSYQFQSAESFLANQNSIAQSIDHTLLQASAQESDIAKLCQEADQYSFASVCVPPTFVSHCRKKISNPNVKVISVVGFPLGYNLSETKAEECQQLLDSGAQEIDMVIHQGKLKAAQYEYVYQDILAVVQAAKNIAVKVILETAELSENEIVYGCLLSKLAGASYVKTSTGFAKSGGARVEAVQLMRAVVETNLGVKASGGIRDFASAKAMLVAGACRLGTSSGSKILELSNTEENTANDY